MQDPGLAAGNAAELRDQISGDVFANGDEGWDGAHLGFNLAIDQQPALIAVPNSAEEVGTVVRFAAANDLRVAPQRTGHNCGPLGSLERTILLKTNALDGFTIDVEGRSVRAEAGLVWEDVVPAASEQGLSVLHGSSPDVGIVGYTLGGGLGWYARKYGLATSQVTAIELVNAAGELVRCDAENDPELFWALRGAGANFGIVTAIEFNALPLGEVYAGALFFPLERAGEVLGAWRTWSESLPDEVTSVGRILRFPPFEEVPEPVRGKSFAIVEAVCLTDAETGAATLAPLRELGPLMDSFAMVPPVGIAELHMDPRDPVPGASAHQLLGPLGEEGIEALVAAAGADSPSTLISVELRHIGGAVAQAGADDCCTATLPGEYAMFAVGLAAGPELTEKANADLKAVAEALAPYEVGLYANFTEDKSEAGAIFAPETLERLRRARSTHDPDGRFHANHEVPAGA